MVRLATDDPAGRTLTLRVAPEGESAFAVDIESSDKEASAISASFASSADEAFHGFGGRRESTNLRGLSIGNWVLDYHFPDVKPAYYYAAPLFISSHGYGLLLDQTENARFRLDTNAEDTWRVAVVGPRARLIVSPKAGPGAIGAITAITGRHRKPPSWSTGPTLSRPEQPGKTTAEYQQAIVDDLDRMANDKLPITAYSFWRSPGSAGEAPKV